MQMSMTEDREIRTVHLGEGWIDKIYIVRGDNAVGTYRVSFRPNGEAYAAGRDHHQKITPEQAAKWKAEYEAWKAWCDLPDDDPTPEPPYNGCASNVRDDCEFVGGGPSICDGSSMVEKITDDDEACFAIARSMAE